MSKEDNFLAEVIKRTESETLKWSNVSPEKFGEFIFQRPYAYQAFTSDFDKDGRHYALVLVHKKTPGHNAHFDMPEEQHSTDLLAILNGKLVSTLNNYNVDGELLSDLSKLVDATNEDAANLFKDFGE